MAIGQRRRSGDERVSLWPQHGAAPPPRRAQRAVERGRLAGAVERGRARAAGHAHAALARWLAHTTYEGCSERDAHVGFFWDVMDALEHEERRAFLRFTWGRSRLPLDHAGFDQQFKIQAFGRHPPDRYYPVAHTCFFSLELPAYTSAAVCYEKLLYAITNCQAIDIDTTQSARENRDAVLVEDVDA